MTTIVCCLCTGNHHARRCRIARSLPAFATPRPLVRGTHPLIQLIHDTETELQGVAS